MRDAQSLLEQILSFVEPAAEGGAVDEPLLRDILGVVERRVLYEISAAVIAGDAAECLRLVAEVATHGVDLAALSRELVEHFRNLLVVRLMEGAAHAGSDTGNEAGSRRLMDLSDEEISLLRDQAASVDRETLIGYYRFVGPGRRDRGSFTLPKVRSGGGAGARGNPASHREHRRRHRRAAAARTEA